jgi:cytochrome c-type biogenesis protein CcmF
VTLAGVSGEESAELRVTFNPLVWWVWVGGILMAIGGLIVMWPQAEKARVQSGYRAVLRPADAVLPDARVPEARLPETVA